MVSALLLVESSIRVIQYHVAHIAFCRKICNLLKLESNALDYERFSSILLNEAKAVGTFNTMMEIAREISGWKDEEFYVRRRGQEVLFLWLAMLQHNTARDQQLITARDQQLMCTKVVECHTNQMVCDPLDNREKPAEMARKEDMGHLDAEAVVCSQTLLYIQLDVIVHLFEGVSKQFMGRPEFWHSHRGHDA